MGPSTGSSSLIRKKKLSKRKHISSNTIAASSTPESSTSAKRKRVNADNLRWKSVKTSHLPGMDDGGGMMMLEELEGVGVEWEHGEGGRKTARFVTDSDEILINPMESVGSTGEALAQDEDEWGGIVDPVTQSLASGEEDEDQDSEVDDVPDFSKIAPEDLAEEDEDDKEIEPEPEFDDDLLPDWREIPLHTSLKRALLGLGFVRPTEIQARSLPGGLSGKDIVGVAETGSGKTLAYSLPILSYLLRSPSPSTSTKRSLSALILCPTRELALQVTEHLSKVVKQALAHSSTDNGDADDDVKGDKGKRPSGPPRISIGSVIGGLSAQKQKRIVERGCDILVATPGRLWDLMKTDEDLAAGVQKLRFLVIDEADRMIENGHFAELESIVGLTQRKARQEYNPDDDDPTFAASATLLSSSSAREDLQTFIYSATLSKDLQQNLKRKTWSGAKKSKGKKTNALEDLVAKLDFRDPNPDVIDLSPEGGKVAMLRESLIECVTSDKDLYLYYFLLRYPGRSLVFVGSIDGIRRLIPLFKVLQLPVYPLHSQLQQKQRLKNLDRFKSSPTGVLIATDVAARGLDIPQVDHVIHFNLPRTADAYIHRSGRTARAQNPGFALQLCSAEEKGIHKSLMKSLGRDEPLPDLPIESGFLPKLRERIRLAKGIEKAQHMVKKDNHDKNWLRETAEAMDIDIESDMLSDGSYDADKPYHQPNKGISSRSKKTSASNVISLKNELRALLAEPLMARGVSAKYPTGGSRVIVDDLIKSTSHPMMLGAGTWSAYEEVVPVIKGSRKSLTEPKVKPQVSSTTRGESKNVPRGNGSGLKVKEEKKKKYGNGDKPVISH